jgi:hypothetical protein
MKNLCLSAFALILLGAGFAAAAQTGNQPSPRKPAPNPSAAAPASTPAVAMPAARPGDVDTPEHLIAALYDVISGEAGKRDWDRFRSLFYAGARLIPSGRNPQGASGARVLTPEDYVTRGQAVFDKEGFFEKSISNRMESWDRIAHIWSTYESRHAKDDPKPFARGINSFQLFDDGSRWWVLSVFWEGEDANHSLPDQYLH